MAIPGDDTFIEEELAEAAPDDESDECEETAKSEAENASEDA